MYQKMLKAGWGDMDFNSHMRNTAYLDKSVDVRFMYFTENGLPISEFLRMDSRRLCRPRYSGARLRSSDDQENTCHRSIWKHRGGRLSRCWGNRSVIRIWRPT